MKRSELKPYLAELKEFVKKLEVCGVDKIQDLFKKSEITSITKNPYIMNEPVNKAILICDIMYDCVKYGLSDKQIEAILDIAELLED